MAVADVLDYIFSGAKITLASIELKALLYLILGGWVDGIRSISFFLDTLFVNYIGTFFRYFVKIINGTIFTKEIISGIMNRLYVFIGIIVFFKLSMLLIKYISSPELVADAKVGVNSLIKRVIFGFGLMLLVPFIFSTAMSLQEAIIEDKVIEKIILPKEDYLLAEANRDYAGNLIAMNILQGFWSPNSSLPPSSRAVKLYNKAVEQNDPSVVGWNSINSGRILGAGEYSYNYFPVMSTVALGYTLYIAIKFCIDIALRGFKLGFLQMMAPLAIVDYIVYGSEDGSFKNWLKLCKGTYLMLFVRVLSLWFIVFVTTLMQKKGTGSLLYIPEGGEVDYLLRAIIILALLAFMMELPKLLSDIFGLDLEGDATVKGLMKSVAGGFKTVAGAGLAMGGAAIGGMFGAAKGTAMGLAHHDHKEVLGALGGNAGGILKAGLGQTSFGGTLVNSTSGAYKNSTGTSEAAHSKVKQDQIRDAEQQQHDKERQEDILRDNARSQRYEDDRQQHNRERLEDFLRDNVRSQISNNPNANRDDIIRSVVDTQINAKLNGVEVGELTADIVGRVSASGGSAETIYQEVEQQLGRKLNVAPERMQQIVEQEVQSVAGNSQTIEPQQAVQVVNQVVNRVVNDAKENIAPEVTQVVNQVMGNVVSNSVSDVTQTVDQKIGSRVDGPNDVTRRVHDVNDAIDDSPIGPSNPPISHQTDNIDDETETL